MDEETCEALLFDPASVVLALPTRDFRAALWQETEAIQDPVVRYRAFVHRLLLKSLVDWLQEDHGQRGQVWPAPGALLPLWNVCDGLALTVAGRRWVVLATESTGSDECWFPREWVDLPGWAADFYLAGQLAVEEGWLRLWGWTTHHRLKTLGQYDDRDCSYGLAAGQLDTDLAGLWAVCTGGVRLAEPLRAETGSPAALETGQARALIARLGKSSLARPRLEVPFDHWGALVAHDGWRRQLFERRQGFAPQWSPVRWLNDGLSATASQVGWMATVPASAEARGETGLPPAYMRPLIIAGNPYELCVSMLQPGIWRFQLRSATWDRTVPANFTLRLLSEDLRSFANNEAHSPADTPELYVDVRLEPGEGLVWEVEPVPDGYEREILLF